MIAGARKFPRNFPEMDLSGGKHTRHQERNIKPC